MNEYYADYRFFIKAKDRDEAGKKIQDFLPESIKDIWYTIDRLSKTDCFGCKWYEARAYRCLIGAGVDCEFTPRTNVKFDSPVVRPLQTSTPTVRNDDEG